ncbi:hypothetical protein [Haemophilus haemolyticus]|uniref:hypothetical protein n=1 Tax=Haemophilus haemolyticus TaxID=726 RepID=UPI001EFD284A|nr:hypothetical protein [Haemophilus haemolyticus]
MNFNRTFSFSKSISQRSILLLGVIDITPKQTLIKIFLIMVAEKIMPKISLSSKWSCDGRELKPKSGGSSSDVWVLSGKEIKPKYIGTSKDVWVWDGRELKPKYVVRPGDIWVVDGDKIKPKVSASSNNTYELNGNPILVAFGQVVLKLW